LILIVFVGLMGIDGVNSYLAFFPALPHLYPPQNWLRLTTGAFYGLAMSVILLPMVSESLWHPDRRQFKPVISGFKELLPLLGGVGVVILAVLWQQPLLLYPLMTLSALGVLLTLTMINTVLALLLSGQAGLARTWGDALPALTVGLALAVAMLGGMHWLRTMLTQLAGLPY